MTHYVLLFAAVSLPAIPAQLSLNQAIAIALQSSPALRRAAARVQQSEANQGQVRSQLLPSVAIGAADTDRTVNLKSLGISTSLLPPRAGPFQSVDARARISQDLLNLPARDRGRAAKEQVRSATHLAADARDLLAFEVAMAFAQALRSQSWAGALTKQLDLARRLHQVTQDRLGQGVASTLDSKRSEIEVHNLEQSLLEAGNDLTAAKLQLANLIHAEPSTAFELTATVYPESLPDPSTRADFRAAESAVHAAELGLSAARHERYPTATFRANYGQSGRAWNDNLNTFQVEGVLNVPIYTGGRIESGIVEAQALLDEAKADLEELRTGIQTETLVARAALESAQGQLAVARKTVELANDEIALSVDRFTGGVADNTEILNAQDRLTRAEENAVKAEFNLHVAQARLRRALGASQ